MMVFHHNTYFLFLLFFKRLNWCQSYRFFKRVVHNSCCVAPLDGDLTESIRFGLDFEREDVVVPIAAGNNTIKADAVVETVVEVENTSTGDVVSRKLVTDFLIKMEGKFMEGYDNHTKTEFHDYLQSDTDPIEKQQYREAKEMMESAFLDMNEKLGPGWTNLWTNIILDLPQNFTIDEEWPKSTFKHFNASVAKGGR